MRRTLGGLCVLRCATGGRPRADSAHAPTGLHSTDRLGRLDKFLGRDKWDYRELERQRHRHGPGPAVRLGDFPRARQLLKARLTTVVLGEASWRAYENGSRRADEAHDVEGVRVPLGRELADVFFTGLR
jgi:hypothetical protein